MFKVPSLALMAALYGLSAAHTAHAAAAASNNNGASSHFVMDVYAFQQQNENKLASAILDSLPPVHGKSRGQASVRSGVARYLQKLALGNKADDHTAAALFDSNNIKSEEERSAILPLTRVTGTTHAHVDHHRAGTGPVVASSDRVAFVMLNSNPNAHFEIDEACIPIVENTLVAFHGGHSMHRTVVESGEVQLLGPFHVENMEPVGIAPTPPSGCPDGEFPVPGSDPVVCLPGCYPTYVGGTSYTVGDPVSGTVTELTPITTETQSCTDGSLGCVNGERQVQVGGDPISVKYNFMCSSPDWCGSAGRGPGEQFESTAWTKMEKCEGTAPLSDFIPAEWSGGGCPTEFVASADDFEPGAIVSVDKGTYSMVYQCAEAPNNLHCNGGGYEPGTGQHWSVAWTELGSCDGTLSPTSSPNYDVLQDVGGCPDEWEQGREFPVAGHYKEGDTIQVNNIVFRCKSFPYGYHCGQDGYVPFNGDAATADAWKDAWDVAGYCDASGSMGPTESPSFDVLQDMGACPDEWEAGREFPVEGHYEEGDTIQVNGIVFSCRPYPWSGHCGQDGYVPFNGDASTADAWKDAWVIAGYCQGSMGPTESPSFDALENVGACPGEWELRDGSDPYVEGDSIAVNNIVFTCKGWPESGHCGQAGYEPLNGDASTADAWKTAWAVSGYCDGSMGPTESPTFDALEEVEGGCPDEYSVSEANEYEYGQQVAITVSDDPERKVVYECKTWPDGDHCKNSAENMRPGEEYGTLGWILKGHCTGTKMPTMAPTVYTGTCQYTKTVVDSCSRNAPAENQNPGSTACSCTDDNTESVIFCTQTTVTTPNVDNWSNSVTYAAGDVVRNGRDRYRCKVPGWCNQSAYEPVVTDIWNQAWTTDGTCSGPVTVGARNLRGVSTKVH